ncbi:UDP-N-acetylmuramate dehydrogenase [Desulfovibrio inopinatus]|uniref:UDP-N-acetylmuramate dehydrogenase n=1 Tax=Desulfovibrio inopinatus TaxID=102109 RepID=UPI000411B9A9|nr:UDP-N-acetylmuramate dehydrogenase [Desulfovibrio inopinatus]
MALRELPEPVLAERTTLRLGGRALAELVVDEPADFDALPGALSRLGATPYVFGWGSNILAKDGELPLVLVRFGKAAGPTVVAETDDTITIDVDAGLRLPVLLTWLAKNGLWGLSGLAGVPGTVGGAVAMNAGSFGCQIKDVLESVVMWSEETGLVRYASDDIDMGYRFFKPRRMTGFSLVASARLKFVRKPATMVRDAMTMAMDNKRKTQPLDTHSAGCVFKNPEGDSAGRLLDVAGFRGKNHGDMAFSDKHANFLVNKGNGTAAQAMELIEMAQNTVLDQFGVALHMEVKTLP